MCLAFHCFLPAFSKPVIGSSAVLILPSSRYTREMLQQCDRISTK